MKATTGFQSQILDSMEQRKRGRWLVIQEPQPEREKQISYDITYIFNLYIYIYIHTYMNKRIYKTEIDSQT